MHIGELSDMHLRPSKRALPFPKSNPTKHVDYKIESYYNSIIHRLKTCGKWFICLMIIFNLCIYYVKPDSLSWENVLVQCGVWATIFMFQILFELDKIEERVENGTTEGTYIINY